MTLWLQLAGLEWSALVRKGVDAEPVPRGLIMPEGQEIDEI